jgi:anthranilate synthase component I
MISLDEVSSLATHYNVIPVTRTLFSGTETPIGVYSKLCDNRTGTFLLESAEHGVWARYSFVGVKTRGRLSFEGEVIWKSESAPLPNGELDADPVTALNQLQQGWKSAPTDYPLASGLVGFISWGLTEHLEKLPARKRIDYKLPLYSFEQFSDVVILDHQNSELILVSLIFVDGAGSLAEKYSEASRSLDSLEQKLRDGTKAFITEAVSPETEIFGQITKQDYLNSVNSAKEFVRAGDVFQVVLSQRFDQPTKGDSLNIYRALRAANPSPYMYFLRLNDQFGDYSIVGSSPEALVQVRGQKVTTHPIAGSRPRGNGVSEDSAFAEELLADEKEKSEHLMLVDLARNDLLRVCEPDSLRVSEFMEVHRFSHIMHLASTVEGTLRQDKSPVDALLATFPAGTLSGAPKPRALEIISELEPSYRGLFGGVVGYFDFSGSADLAIAIRTALVRDGVAYVQAGAGIVLDSIPELEYCETINKAAVVIKSIARANEMAHE